MDRFRAGVTLNDGERTRPAKIRRLGRGEGPWVEAAITEGRNRQLRRMMAALGYDVQDLLRTRIGPVSLEGLNEGSVRPLTGREVMALKLT
jgi:pseudouridine synthase